MNKETKKLLFWLLPLLTLVLGIALWSFFPEWYLGQSKPVSFLRYVLSMAYMVTGLCAIIHPISLVTAYRSIVRSCPERYVVNDKELLFAIGGMGAGIICIGYLQLVRMKDPVIMFPSIVGVLMLVITILVVDKVFRSKNKRLDILVKYDD